MSETSTKSRASNSDEGGESAGVEGGDGSGDKSGDKYREDFVGTNSHDLEKIKFGLRTRNEDVSEETERLTSLSASKAASAVSPGTCSASRRVGIVSSIERVPITC